MEIIKVFKTNLEKKTVLKLLKIIVLRCDVVLKIVKLKSQKKP